MPASAWTSRAQRPNALGRSRWVGLAALSMIVSSLAIAEAPLASAQGPGWVRQFGTRKDETGWSVAYAADGIYAVGTTVGQFPGLTSKGAYDAFLVKYDLTGTRLWSRQFGTPASDDGFAVAADATGVYVTGRTGGTLGQKSLGRDDAYLRKFTPDGKVSWTVQFGTRKGDNAVNLTIGPDGVSVIGATDGVFPGERDRGVSDAFLAQFDTTGALLWVRQFGSNDYDLAYGPGADANGIVVTGYTDGTFPGQTERGAGDAFAVAFTPDGHRRWIHQFGTRGRDESLGVSLAGGVAYVSGMVDGTLPGQHGRGSADAFIRAYASDGTVVWTRQFGTPRGEEATSVAADATGVYAVGETAGRFGHHPNLGGVDVFVRAYTAAGDRMWTTQFGSDGNDTPWWNVTDGAGSVFLAGRTDGTMPTQTAIGRDDAFVANVT